MTAIYRDQYFLSRWNNFYRNNNQLAIAEEYFLQECDITPKLLNQHIALKQSFKMRIIPTLGVCLSFS